MDEILNERPSTDIDHHKMQIGIDIEAMLRNPQGRRVLMWIFQQCHVFGPVYTGDAASTNFCLGERNVGLRLAALIKTVGPTEFESLLLDMARMEVDRENVTYAQSDDADPTEA